MSSTVFISVNNDLVSNENPYPVKIMGAVNQAGVTLTRPANTTAYAAGDAVGIDPGTGTAQVETATVVGTVVGSGDAAVVVTSAILTGSPLSVSVAVVALDDASAVAGKIRTALAAVAAITAHYTVGGTGADVVLTALVAAANDATLNISTDNDTCTGLTAAPTSANTTAGSLASASAGSAILTFAAIGPVGALIRLDSADLRIDLAAVPAGMAGQRLHLYDAAPDAILDNAAWDLSSAGDRAKYLGYVDLGTPVDVGSTLFVQTGSLNKPVKLADGSTSLFGVLQTTAGYTPAASTVAAIRLNATVL